MTVYLAGCAASRGCLRAESPLHARSAQFVAQGVHECSVALPRRAHTRPQPTTIEENIMTTFDGRLTPAPTAAPRR